jgi:hypothetical protein
MQLARQLLRNSCLWVRQRHSVQAIAGGDQLVVPLGHVSVSQLGRPFVGYRAPCCGASVAVLYHHQRAWPTRPSRCTLA